MGSLNLGVEKFDVKTTFLHSDLKEEIYMMQYEGFETKGKEEYSKLVSFMINHGYQGITSDHCVFVKNFWIKISLYSVGFWLIFSLGLNWAEDENREPCVGLTHQGWGLGAKALIFILVHFRLMSKRRILETLASSR